MPCGHCRIGAPYDGPFRGIEQQCVSCWYWDNHVKFREIWEGPPDGRILETSASQKGFAPAASPPPSGAGTALTNLFLSLSIREVQGCNCAAVANEMDEKGPAWCAANKPYLLGKLNENAAKFGWKEKLAAAWNAGTAGYWSLESILDESIRIAAEKSR